MKNIKKEPQSCQRGFGNSPKQEQKDESCWVGRKPSEPEPDSVPANPGPEDFNQLRSTEIYKAIQRKLLLVDEFLQGPSAVDIRRSRFDE